MARLAIAGYPNAGKSSLFNALAGADLAEAGVRRPTTAHTSAVVWGEGGEDLLDWLEVPRRHRREAADDRLAGLVLLDLPDHDSTEVAHRLEVDRLVALVDLLVWVVDPQKYADAALHEHYLRPLASHGEVTMVVLNHLDELSPSRRAEVLQDLRRRVAEDGLGEVPVLGTSARTGQGVDLLRDQVAARVSGKRAAVERLRADVRAVAGAMLEASGEGEPGAVTSPLRATLVEACAQAAAVPTVVRAVERSVARRGNRHTGWPVTAWLTRLRPDPLRRLHLDLGSHDRLASVERHSVPEPTPVQRAQVDTAVRALATEVGQDMAAPWQQAIRRASVARLPDIDDGLDRAVSGTDLGAARVPLWWRLARALQLMLLLATVGGAVWLGFLAVLGWLQLPVPQVPEEQGVPWPTLLLLGGVAGGLLLGLLGRVVNRWVARSRARGASRRLRAAIEEVVDELVVAPVEVELAAYDDLRAALRTARR